MNHDEIKKENEELACSYNIEKEQKQQAELENREMEAREKFEVQPQLADPPRTTSPSKPAVPNRPTRVKTKQPKLLPMLRWKQCKDMPCAMSSLQSVMLQGEVYAGGGVTLTHDNNARTLYKYHPQKDQWVELVEYKYVWFAIAILDNKLTVIGGYDTSTKIATNQIAVWEMNQWTHPYPHMRTQRHSPAVATYNNIWLVVAGGIDNDHNNLDTVELFNTGSHQWLSTTPLPVECRHMTSAIVQNNLFLIGGTLAKRALVVSLDEITATEQSGTSSTPTKTSAQWRSLPETPLEYSAAIALNGSLLTVGGRLGNDYSTAVHIYRSETEQWSKVGDLPTPRSSFSCILLPSREILVVGGRESPRIRTPRVDAVTITYPQNM